MHPPPPYPAEIARLVHSVVDQETIIAITDKRGVIVYANDRFCEISGFNRGELLGRTHRVLKSGIHPLEFYKNLWSTILGGRTWRGEICNRAKDGHLYWVETTITPLREQGLITHFISLRTDITARKEIEELLAQQQKRLEEERRMEALGRMADGVLHDLGNILTGMMGLVSEGENDHQIARLQDPLGRMLQLIRTLRDYSTGRPTKVETFRLNPLLACACSLVRYRQGIPRNLSVNESFRATANCEVSGNEGQVFEVVLNLVVNAAEATATGRTPEINVRTMMNGPMAVVVIEDSGPGVAEAIIPAIFEPFSTTKGRGRGLGLSVARQMARAHNGDLLLDDAGGGDHGARFRLELPAQLRPDEPRLEETSATEPQRFVLVCEDDADVRRLIERAAREIGLTVMYPGDTADLLALAAKMTEVLAAAVIDSCEVESDQGSVACLRRLMPDLPILLISASVPTPGRRRTPWGEVDSLPKPFGAAELAVTLRAATNKARV